MVGVDRQFACCARGGPYGASGGTKFAPNSPTFLPAVVVQGETMLMAQILRLGDKGFDRVVSVER